ncbi:MAG TPA: polysaccharide deacetylase family protein, partial [Xylella sp.]
MGKKNTRLFYFFIRLCILLILVACKRQPSSVESEARITAISVKVRNTLYSQQVELLLVSLHKQLENYRRIMVLFADDDLQTSQERLTSTQVGQMLFNEGLNQRAVFSKLVDELFASSIPARFGIFAVILDYIESAPDLYDADRLAFRETLNDLDARIGNASVLPALKLRQRIHEDIDALTQIERVYNQEIARISSPFDHNRGIVLKRQKWVDYIVYLRSFYTRKMILRDYGMIEADPMSVEGSELEMFGNELPLKTLVLTFDDGPHRVYTREIKDILKRYAVPAVFFEVGRNLGRLDSGGKPRLGALSKISGELIEEGYAVGNHSMTHDLLSKLTGQALRREIMDPDILLRAIDARRAPLFRFPYGARNVEGLRLLSQMGLKSVRWNIDSLDWADPVPNSVARRVLAQVSKKKRGIILFHDIHDRAVKALPQILDQLIADGYQFAGWDGHGFSVNHSQPRNTEAEDTETVIINSHSWATVIGVDDYNKWPKLKYAVNDAQAIANTLVESLGFPSSHVILLKNREATHDKIMAAFNTQLTNSRIQKNDRLFVFFAGHGAVRRLSFGHDLGYIIPADSNPGNFATDAISMTEIQNIAENFQAKHVLFVIDACYSGLRLTPGAIETDAHLPMNIHRMSRQMLTA